MAESVEERLALLEAEFKLLKRAYGVHHEALKVLDGLVKKLMPFCEAVNKLERSQDAAG